MKARAFESLPFQRGVTLTEAMIVLAIIGILAALAVPSFQRQMQQQRIEGAAESLDSAMQNAKLEAVTTGNDTAIVITTGGSVCTGTDCENQANAIATWCYGTTPAGAATCDCTAANSCVRGSVVQSADFAGVGITYNTSNKRTFAAKRSTATSGTIRFFTGNNKTLGVTTSSIGRIRICKDSASTITSYADSGTCP